MVIDIMIVSKGLALLKYHTSNGEFTKFTSVLWHVFPHPLNPLRLALATSHPSPRWPPPVPALPPGMTGMTGMPVHGSHGMNLAVTRDRT